MISNDDALDPDVGPQDLDWLDAPALSARVDDEDGNFVTVSWADPEVSAEISQAPSCNKLAVLVQRRFTVTISPDVKLPDDFALFVFVEPGVPASCDVRIPARRVVCGPRPASTGTDQAQHTLVLSTPAHVTIEGDNWNIEPQPGLESAGISLEVTNAQESLSILGSLPITSLESSGDHEYSLDLQADATVVVRSGTATLRQGLESVSVSGNGSVRALGGMHSCHVELGGGLEVHHELLDSEIAIGGFFEAIGSVRLGQRSLRCGDAHLSGALESADKVRCKRLHVEGPIEQTDTLTVETLDCRGLVTARQLTVSGDVAIHKNATCENLTGGGNIEIRGDPSGIDSLTWKPSGSGRRLEFRHPDAQIPLVSARGARPVSVDPELRLAQGSEIHQLHVDVPELGFAVLRNNASKESERRAAIGLSLTRNGAVLRLAQDTLHLRLTMNRFRFSLEVPAEAKIEILECPTDIPRVAIRGDGEVRFADMATSARLRRVELTGRLKFSSSMHIDQLQAAAWPSDAPESSAEEANPAPRLNFEPGIIVEQARGVCRLEHLHARITGDPIRDFATEHIASSNPTDGHLTNVNVNNLPDGQIPLLKHLRVLEISGKSLKRLAGERTRLRCALATIKSGMLRTSQHMFDENSRKPMARPEIRARAETAAQLADILGGKVNSGASRAWLHWAVARLQHRGLNKWSIERPLRAAYRTMGYGFRPRPALQTWFAVALLGLGYAWFGGYAANTSDIAFGWQWIGRYIEILLLPIGYLRLGAVGAEPMFQPSPVDLVGRILIGLPFLFVVLGTRQYFRSPVKQDRRTETP